MGAVFSAGSMQEINGKRVEVKAATPKGSGPVGRGPVMPGAMPGRGMGFDYQRGMMAGRYPGDYGGWAMHPAYMPVGYSGYMPAYGAYPGMMMGGFPMQYGAMGYPMQQQPVPGVVGGMQRQQQSSPQFGYGGMQPVPDQRGGQGGRAASEGQAGSSRAARRQQQQSKNEGGAEAVKLPDNLNPTAGEQQAGTPAAGSS